MDRLGERSDTALREILLEAGEPVDTKSSVSNYANTGKYTLASFLPLAAADRLFQLSSLWFLFVILLEADVFSAGYDASYTTLALFCMSLAVSLSKAAAEMYRCRARELSINLKPQKVWRGGKFVTCACKDLRVGECVLITDEERIPADMLLLASSAIDGTCHVNTIRTLGEKSLAMKTAVRETQRLLPSTSSPSQFNFDRLEASLKVEPPNQDFLSFSGSIKLKPLPRSIPLKYDNFLLRGSAIVGEQWILATVLYAGIETKFWSNVEHPPRRPSFLERLLTMWTICAFCAVMMLASLQFFLQFELSQEAPVAADFVRYLLLSHSLIPITLFLGVDLLRLVHARMCHDKSQLLTVNSNCLVEDLGKVNYVLADKTGTMTQGELELLAVLIGFQMYTKVPIFHQAKPKKMKLLVPAQPSADTDKAFTFDDLRRELESKRVLFRRFCECIALCNSMIPLPDGTFRGTSDDERALLDGASALGFSLLERNADEKSISLIDVCVEFKVVCVKNFSADVKRMRILVKQEVLEGGTLFIKGSYNSLKAMLNLDADERTTLERKLELMSEKGLRTMVLCYRFIDPEYLADIESRVETIKSSHSLSANSEGSLEVLFMELENNLSYLGVTGVRDHLQPGALDCIETLKSTGIATWLVSGDAESNSVACARELTLIPPGSRIVELGGLKRTEDCLAKLKQKIDENCQSEFNQTEASLISPESGRGEKSPRNGQFVLSIDGQSLETAVREEETQELLLTLMLSAKTVCFNTMHPSHKRKAVSLLKIGMKTHPVVMAIGDGVNDIPMLLEADISMGLRGDRAEGVSNVNACSVAGLPSLLLRTGRRSAVLISKSVLLLLHAQILNVSLMALNSFLGNFTPVRVVDWDGQAMFSLIICLVPIAILCSLQSRYPVSPSSDQTVLYRSNAVLNGINLLRYSLLALSHCGCICALVFPACFTGSSTTISTEELACLTLLAMSITVVVQCAVEANRFLEAPVLLVSMGCLCAYYCAEWSRLTAFVALLSQAKYDLALAGVALSGAVMSITMRKLCEMSDLRKLLTSKVVPMSFHNSDLRSIKRASRSFVSISPTRISEKSKSLDIPFAIRRGTCRFESSQTEKRFQSSFFRASAKQYWRLLALVLVQTLVPLVISLASTESARFSISLKSTLLTATCVLTVLFLVRNIAQYSAEVFGLGVALATFVLNFIVRGVNAYVFFYVTVCVVLFLREKWIRNVAVAIAASVMLAASELYRLSASDSSTISDSISAVYTIVAQFFTLLVCAKISHFGAITAREEFKLVEESKAKIEQSDTILGYLLPDFVCNMVKDGFRYIAEDQGEVSVIFIDICDFDSICASYSATELIGLLDEVFQRIDELCSSLHVAKIETVGKTYLACAGLRDFEMEHTGEYTQIQHARRALELAFAVLRNFKSMQLTNRLLLSFKIGVSSGPVIAGVVGHHKPQFVLVGDTVNTASRMSSTLSERNSIQISESTKSLVCDLPEYEFEPREIEVKGKGAMKTYTVKHALKHHTYILKEGVETRSQSSNRSSIRARRYSISVNDISKLEEIQEARLLEKVGIFTSQASRDELDFSQSRLHSLLPTVRLSLAVYSVGLFGLFAARVMTGAVQSRMALAPTVLYIILATVVAGLALFLSDICDRRCMPWAIVGVYSIGSALIAADKADNGSVSDSAETMVVGLLLVLATFGSGLLFRPAAVAALFVVVPHETVWLSRANDCLELAFFAVVFVGQSLVQLYSLERAQRAYYNMSKLAFSEIEKTEQLLTHMIPIQAIESLKQGQWSTDKLVDVTILFADISGFTKWASSHSPARVIGKLGTIFTEFDKICVRKNLYKVCTIGDCYVALSSTSNTSQESPGDQCVRMAKFALKMARTVEEICRQDKEDLKMRIGLHVGQVVAGITGSKIVRYDIYGPDVVVANKMESSGAVGRVNVSSEVRSLLEQTAKGLFTFEHNTRVDLPDIGKRTESYFIKRVLTARK